MDGGMNRNCAAGLDELIRTFSKGVRAAEPRKARHRCLTPAAEQ